MTPEHGDLDRKLAELEGLYQRDPERFQRRSRQLIEDFLAETPPHLQARMYGLQRRIDAELGHYRDPVARMNRMVELLWEHIHYFLEVLEHPETVLKARKNRPAAKVLPFRRRKSLH